MLVAPAGTRRARWLSSGVARAARASSPPARADRRGGRRAGRAGRRHRGLARRRDELSRTGLAARTAAFSSPAPGDDSWLASEPRRRRPLAAARGRGAARGARRPSSSSVRQCDVALLVRGGRPARPGPVIVPFGGAWHDWAALELGSWVARATGGPLRLIGAAAGGREDGRDASRLLADASLIVQRNAGDSGRARCSRSPGREGVAGAGRRRRACWWWGSPSAGARRGWVARAEARWPRRRRRPSSCVAARDPGGLAPAETRDPIRLVPHGWQRRLGFRPRLTARHPVLKPSLTGHCSSTRPHRAAGLEARKRCSDAVIS